MKIYANKGTWLEMEEYLYQCKIALLTKDCVIDAMREHFGSRMTRKSKYLVQAQYRWMERFVKNPNLLTGHMVTWFGLKAEKELGMDESDKESLRVIGARLFDELPEEQQEEARLLAMQRMF